MRAPLLIVALLGCLACGPVRAEGDFTAVPITTKAVVAGLEFMGGARLSWPAKKLGGLSAASLDGRTLTMLSDRGRWFRLRLSHAPDGRLLGVEPVAAGALGGRDGKPVKGRWRDAESLARPPRGMVVSFERHHRLWLYPRGLDGAPRDVPLPPETAELPDNGGLETVAASPDGDLLVIAEDGGSAWTNRAGHWTAATWRLSEGFAPTDAAILDDGSVLVLERRFTLLGGWAARLRTACLADFQAGGVVDGVEIARLERPFPVDNMEALAVGRAADGGLLLHLLSDDNFSLFQASLLLVFRLPAP
ncbi:MAG: esterase-like activity of phytase family protein [Alphaproteobacteria bacterium]|nr:esterase-like activity of phytase family protein [Alphaproteobacteria bacterium]